MLSPTVEKLPWYILSPRRMHLLLATVLSLLYAIFIALFPFESFFGVGFSDRENYLYNFIHVYSRIDNHFASSPIHWIVNQSLWSFSYVHVADIVGSSIAALNLLSFFSAFMLSHYALTRSAHVLYGVLLFNPLLIDFFLSQQRQSLAFAVFLVVLTIPSLNAYWRLVFIFVSSTIHFSFVAIGPFLAFKEKISQFSLKYLNVITINVVLLIAVLLFRYFSEPLYTSVQLFLGDGDRESDYAHLVAGTKYLTIWVVYLVIAFLSGRRFLAHGSSFVAVCLISLFVICNALELSGIRLLTVAYPFFLISLKYLPFMKRILFVILFLMYMLVYWLYWTQTLVTS